MTPVRRTTTRRALAAAIAAILLLVLVFGATGALDPIRDQLTGGAEIEPVPILQQGATTAAEPDRTWAIDVAPGQALIVSATAVELVRQDEGSRIDNTNPDRILLAAEGGHPYTLTIQDGRWTVVAEADARQEFCNHRRSQDGDWGVEYKPASWPPDPC